MNVDLPLICLRSCKHVQPPPYAGKCECRYDKAAPVDILCRVAKRFCPAGKFPATDEQVEELIARDDAEGGCGCDGSGYRDG